MQLRLSLNMRFNGLRRSRNKELRDFLPPATTDITGDPFRGLS